MEKPNDIKRDSISVNYFLNTAAYSGLFSLLSVILTGQVSAESRRTGGYASFPWLCSPLQNASMRH